MTTIADVFKMFPLHNSRTSKTDKGVKKQSKTITSCFSEGMQEGCEIFTKQMGCKTKNK